MNGGISIAHLVITASVPVQAIMSLLLLASLFSWVTIAAKRSMLARTRREAESFEGRFWSGGNLHELYNSVREDADEGLPSIFKAGYEEFSRFHGQGKRVEPEDALPAIQRALRVSQLREVERLEGGVAMLATIGSTSPYVGLFGTVWGIMNAFISIGNVKQATLAMVAPGIAEALIATAMGLFAAIPAVIAYNYFTNQVERIDNRYHTFAEELIGILDRGLRSGTR
jgi:biopolymer transport protein TolQ